MALCVWPLLCNSLQFSQKPCKKTGCWPPSCAVFRRLLSEYSCSQSARRNWCLLGISFVSHKKYSTKSWAELTVSASVSQHVCLKRHLPILWSLVLCSSSQECWCAAAHKSEDVFVLGFLSGGLWRKEEGGIFPKCRRLQALRVTRCRSHWVFYCSLPLTSHLLISLKFHSNFISTLGLFVSQLFIPFTEHYEYFLKSHLWF